jgi:hypothetical protein
VKLRFLGTRGEIELRTPRHGRHSALRVSHRRHRLVVDCGNDWHGRIAELDSAALGASISSSPV